MKKKSAVVSLLTILFLATGCDRTNPSVSSPSSTENTSSPSEFISSVSSVTPADTSLAAPVTVDSISSLYDVADGTEVVIEGVVLQIAYSGSNEPESFVVADNTGTIVVHGSDSAKNLKAGYSVTVKGNTTHWISSTEGNAASEAGYTGALQIENTTLLSTDTTNHEIPDGAVI